MLITIEGKYGDKSTLTITDNGKLHICVDLDTLAECLYKATEHVIAFEPKEDNTEKDEKC